MYTAVSSEECIVVHAPHQVGTTWEISGLMNLILSLHFARVFLQCCTAMAAVAAAAHRPAAS